ncbi:MAG: 23S rRNA (guanosine(2251)-2'-O)-methyltransferase RlmB [Deltaproteobacteria bacterium]|nr:23S rRNA (guanosine(2251)-2'-O)-methyltransferase RlmB [Deltaproteobacteria bacterium]
MREMTDESVVYGVNPVSELLRAKRRRIKRIYLLSGSRNPAIKRIYNVARESGTDIKFTERDMLGNIAKSSEHQGVVALCEPVRIFSYREFLENQVEFERILIINNVQDPHNLGAVLRSAYLFSFRGIILTRKNTVSVTPAVVKASAGAVEYVSIAVEDNLPQVIIELRRANYKIVSLDISGDVSIKSLEVRPPLVVIVGGEDTGIGKKLLTLSDYVVKIPVSDESFSLNLSVSAAIIMQHLFDGKLTISSDDRGI